MRRTVAMESFGVGIEFFRTRKDGCYERALEAIL